ncbi:hypothetical protein GCM10009818_06120 [Nakamurella flavida]|nr:HU family DNA-binding protein [Nakamurella flavida]
MCGVAGWISARHGPTVTPQSAHPFVPGRNSWEGIVNKTDLINQLAERLDGDKKAAQAAVEGIIDLVQREVHKGSSVSISGFGVFEKRARAARTARNPRTGDAVKVKKTTVPAFRPGKYFKDVIAGTVKLPKPTGKPTTARAAAALAKSGPARTTTTRAPRAAAATATATAPATRAATTRTRAAAAKTAATTAAEPAKTTTRAPRATAAKTAAAKPAAARTTAAKAPAKTAAAKAPAAAKTTAAKAPAKTAAAKAPAAAKTTAAKAPARRTAAKAK